MHKHIELCRVSVGVYNLGDVGRTTDNWFAKEPVLP